jgi:hypothetical protein
LLGRSSHRDYCLAWTHVPATSILTRRLVQSETVSSTRHQVSCNRLGSMIPQRLLGRPPRPRSASVCLLDTGGLRGVRCLLLSKEASADVFIQRHVRPAQKHVGDPSQILGKERKRSDPARFGVRAGLIEYLPIPLQPRVQYPNILIMGVRIGRCAAMTLARVEPPKPPPTVMMSYVLFVTEFPFLSVLLLCPLTES